MKVETGIFPRRGCGRRPLPPCGRSMFVVKYDDGSLDSFDVACRSDAANFLRGFRLACRLHFGKDFVGVNNFRKFGVDFWLKYLNRGVVSVCVVAPRRNMRQVFCLSW